ncbi:hypothetical protein N7519_006406 [Penicillium mononematosum]|uniref:uncharacterized protein n=1 Tax=Penicillium mononematosum TaxID=268346 RepID=UPI0025478F59|nr:uncharacterized protein N7519_006406 [Penicillium mononematosum]KAJ6185105.1 hypothetical protein N7519_006406 [Penicillium mononematosum]
MRRFKYRNLAPETGQVLERVFGAEGVNIRSADFKSTGTGYSKTPDAAIVSHNGPPTPKAVAEQSCTYPTEQGIRHAIEQLVEYMIDQKVLDGFHSTYEESIFLTPSPGQRGEEKWSKVIDNCNTGPSLRQCFWYLPLPLRKP